jgi:hypothetical protein
MKSLTFCLLLSVILFSCKKDSATSISLTRSDDGKVVPSVTVTTSCTSCDLTQPITINGSGFTHGMQITAEVLKKNPLTGDNNYYFESRYTAATVDRAGNFSFNFDASAYEPSEWKMEISQQANNLNRYLRGTVAFSTY